MEKWRDIHSIIQIVTSVGTIGGVFFTLIKFVVKPIRELNLLYKELNIKREEDEKDIVRVQADLITRTIICDERHSWSGEERRKT